MEKVKVLERWREMKFEVLVIERKKSSLKVSDAANHGVYPFFTSGDVTLLHDRKTIEGKNIYLATGGVANVKYYDGEASYSTDTYTLSTNESADTSFLYYLLNSILYFINANYFQGSGLKHLQKKDLRKHIFSIPRLITEQQKIAEILIKVDKAITQTEAIIEKYNRIKTGLMQDLLTKGIDEQGNIRSEATHEFKDSPLGRIPKEWKVLSLGKIAAISSGVTLGKEYHGLGTGLFPYLRVANVQDGYLDLEEIKYIKAPTAFLSKYKLQKGDVLMNEGGDYDKLGRGTVWNDELENCLHQNHVFKVRSDKTVFNPNYLALYSASQYGKTFFLLASKQSTNLASINKSQLKEFPILLPDIKEQNRILDILAKQTKTGNEYSFELKKLQSLKTGLMQDLLSGRVRVNHLLQH